MVKAIIFVIVAFAFTGCAKTIWYKDVTQAEFERDRADCEGRLYQSPHTTSIAGAAVMGPAIMDACMRSKGYTKEPPTQKGATDGRGIGPVATPVKPATVDPMPAAPSTPSTPATPPTPPTPPSPPVTTAVIPPTTAPGLPELRAWAPGKWRSTGGTNTLVIQPDLNWEWSSSFGGNWTGSGRGELRDGKLLLRGWHSTRTPMELRLLREGDMLLGELETRTRVWNIMFVRE
jgi:hypothetical protein